MNDADPIRPTESEAPDAGFTLIEILIAMIVLGIVMSTLAAAMSIVFSVLPDAEDRLDDARATRTLGTWLAQDTISTPPFVGEQAQGGMIKMSDDPANSNDCGGAGVNLLHLQWTQDASRPQTFVANYRFVDGPNGAVIHRYACASEGAGPFVTSRGGVVTSGLRSGITPVVAFDLDDATGGVVRVKFFLTGDEGESVRVDTSSRNPADFFTP